MNLKTILAATLIFVSGMAMADDTSDAVLNVAQSKTSQYSTIFGEQMRTVYVGKFDGCDAVSIFWTGDGIRNYRVCNGVFQEVGDVSPMWDSVAGNQTYNSVITDTQNNGFAQQKDPNGYLIFAHRLNTFPQDRCAKFEVIVSFNGDLCAYKIVQDCN